MSHLEETGATLDIAHLREQVRHALEHLYDADVLAGHWLTHQLHLAHLPAGSRLVRQALIDAIQSMRPSQGEPPGSQRWLMHQILLQRYVQQIGPNDLADQQGMSSRTLRRLQRRALTQLAEILLQQIQHQGDQSPPGALTSAPSNNALSATIIAANSASAASDDPASRNASPPFAATPAAPNQWIQTVEDEIGWMRNVSLSEAVDAAALLGEALQTLAPLLHSTKTLIENHIPSHLPEVSIHPSALRQLFLSLLSHAVKEAATGSVSLSTTIEEARLTITICSLPAATRLPASLPEPQMIVARRILSVFGGEIEQTQEAGGPLSVRITLMIAGGTSVLIIDDNRDVLQLYERYVLGTRFRLTLCQKAELALQVAASLQPQIIIIDIMMPGLDGWSLLGQLSHHPATAAIPVIVSTVVSERDLALTLGAVDFVQKPVTRAEFLDALTRWATAPVSH